jgi:acetoacetyl-CoA synthetase
VVGYLPKVPAAVVAFLACASLGAVWSACAPDFGPSSAVDRFGQLEPTVLVTADGYRFGGKERDRRDAVDGLPTVRAVVAVPVLGRTVERDGVPVVAWDDAVGTAREPEFAQVDAEAPLWVVYSSGTTGLPRGLVHGHAGALLMGLVQLGLHYDVGPDDRCCWYTTTSWIVWNILVSALAVGATAVLYDGSPLWPSPDRLWQLAEDTRLTRLGTSRDTCWRRRGPGCGLASSTTCRPCAPSARPGRRCRRRRSGGCATPSATTWRCTSSAAAPTSPQHCCSTRPGVWPTFGRSIPSRP